ncbi:MAG: type III pantothenate kinase [Chlorobi bacterium]|nr:type III pantothenate kinase [Chlorobiota bacterium]
MNLVIDIGNSFTKTAIFAENKLKEKKIHKNSNFSGIINQIKKIKQKNPETDKVILSSVKDENKKLQDFLTGNFKKNIIFDETVDIPVKNYYKTPETLGKDRLAGVIAASNIFPDCNVLIFDAGTALTVDFINNKKEYFGGSIAPGLEMRYKALNVFTDKLPEISINKEFNNIYGADTKESVISGVQNGILYEIEGHINRFSEKYNDLKVTFTGGDTFFFERKIKKQIFAEPNLVLIGLNIILNYNAK